MLFQGFSALVIYGKLPITAPPWLGRAHRASGTLALVLAAFVAYHCLWALSTEYGHIHSGEKVGARTVIHGVVGCTIVGAAVVKVVAVRSTPRARVVPPGGGRAALHAVHRRRS